MKCFSSLRRPWQNSCQLICSSKEGFIRMLPCCAAPRGRSLVESSERRGIAALEEPIATTKLSASFRRPCGIPNTRTISLSSEVESVSGFKTTSWGWSIRHLQSTLEDRGDDRCLSAKLPNRFSSISRPRGIRPSIPIDILEGRAPRGRVTHIWPVTQTQRHYQYT